MLFRTIALCLTLFALMVVRPATAQETIQSIIDETITEPQVICFQFCCVVDGVLSCPEPPEDPPGSELMQAPGDPLSVDRLRAIFNSQNEAILQFQGQEGGS